LISPDAVVIKLFAAALTFLRVGITEEDKEDVDDEDRSLCCACKSIPKFEDFHNFTGLDNLGISKPSINFTSFWITAVLS
jgi:hypothetical protein